MPKKEKQRKQSKDNFLSSGAEVKKLILFRMGFFICYEKRKAAYPTR